MGKYLFIIPFLFFATSVFAGPPSNVNQVAYLKVNKNRIFIYEFTGKPTTDEMIKYISQHPPRNSDRRMTAAYYFKKGTRMPLSGFNTVGSIEKGNSILYESTAIDSWDFAYMQSFKGDKKLVNCLSNPGHDLCKQ